MFPLLIQTMTMNTNIQRLIFAAALLLPFFPGNAVASERKLDFANATRLEERHSMAGIRNTLLFYTYADQKAVLQLQIDNKDTTFPVSGHIHLFSNETTKEGIEKWINNQHSDGLHLEVPTPVLSQPLPAGQCTVTARKTLETVKNPITDDLFQDYEVTLLMKAYQLEGKVLLASFTDKARVYVKQHHPVDE